MKQIGIAFNPEVGDIVAKVMPPIIKQREDYPEYEKDFLASLKKPARGEGGPTAQQKKQDIPAAELESMEDF